jgi:hypothetical protein
MMEGVNPTKIYLKHIYKYNSVSPVQPSYANKIIKKEHTGGGGMGCSNSNAS